MADPDFNPRQRVDWAESASSSDRQAPPVQVRNNGYANGDVLPHEEFNHVLYASGDNLDSLSRTVGVYESTESFLSKADPGDYGYLYDPSTFDWANPVTPVVSESYYSGSSTEPVLLDSNGETIVVGYGDQVNALGSSLQNFKWSYSTASSVIFTSVSVGENYTTITYTDSGVSKIFILQNNASSPSEGVEVTISTSPPGVPYAEVGPDDKAIVWHSATSDVYLADLRQETVNTLSTSAPQPFSNDPNAVFFGDICVFSTNDGVSVHKYELASDTWTALDTSGQSTVESRLESDGVSLFLNYDYGSGDAVHRQRVNFDNSEDSLATLAPSAAQNISVNGDLEALVSSSGDLEVFDTASSDKTPISLADEDVFGSSTWQNVVVDADRITVVEDPSSGYTIKQFRTSHRPRYVYYAQSGELPGGRKIVGIPSH